MVSDRHGALALQRAARAGIAHNVVAWEDHSSREEFCDALAALLDSADVDLVVLAGFMRVLTPALVQRFAGRIINVHPSLLPAFPGMNAVSQALAEGVETTGVTVHYVDEGVDTGPVIAQREVPVLSGDDERSLHERIQVEEHDLLPRVVRSIVEHTIEVGAP